MNREFERDPFPGRPKILFIGYAESTHTHSWIDLLRGSDFNVRLFGLSGGEPPKHWEVKTYLPVPLSRDQNRFVRKSLLPAGRVGKIFSKGLAHLLDSRYELEERWLGRVIRRWRPHIIHTLGLDPAGHIYCRVRTRYHLSGNGKWVLQLRGGSDLALSRFDASQKPAIAAALTSCDQLLSDNPVNFGIARSFGLRDMQIAPIAPVPGTGGVDIDALQEQATIPTAARRSILLPKAYECRWSKALPVLEAIKLAWEKLQPCEIRMCSVSDDVRLWYAALPSSIREVCHISDRIPRQELLSLMCNARVMLAPSLIDGTPSSLFEAMAAGALPIVSPLETITPLVANRTNVLFARNLYPNEIAAALAEAMNDDALVDRVAANNLALVTKIANRSEIRQKVIEYYRRLASTTQARDESVTQVRETN